MVYLSHNFINFVFSKMKNKKHIFAKIKNIMKRSYRLPWFGLKNFLKDLSNLVQNKKYNKTFHIFFEIKRGLNYIRRVIIHASIINEVLVI